MGRIVYSTYRIAPAPRAERSFLMISARLFSVPLHSLGQGFSTPLNEQQTNLIRGGNISDVRNLHVTRVAWDITGTNPSDVSHLYNSSVIYWDFDRTEVSLAPSNVILDAAPRPGSLTCRVNWIDLRYPTLLPYDRRFGLLFVYEEAPIQQECFVRMTLTVTEGA